MLFRSKNEKKELLKKYGFKYLSNGKMCFKREESYIKGVFEMASEESYTYELVCPETKEFYSAMDYAQRINTVYFNQNNERIREQRNNQIRYKDDTGSWTEWMTYIGGISDSVAIDYVDRRRALQPTHKSDFYTHNLFVTDSNNFICKHHVGSNITKKRFETDAVIKRTLQRTTSKSQGSSKRWDYDYDIFGRLLSVSHIDFNHECIEAIIYGYDELDRCISSKRDYTKSGEPISEVLNYSYKYFKDRGHILTHVTLNGVLYANFEINNDSVFTINYFKPTDYFTGDKIKVKLLDGWQNYLVYEYTNKGNLLDQKEVKDGRNVYTIRNSFNSIENQEVCYLRKESYFPTENTPIIERHYDGDNKLVYERIGDSYRRLIDGVLKDISN